MKTLSCFRWQSAFARLILIAFVSFVICSSALVQPRSTGDVPSSQLKTGKKVPELSGVDQFGKRQNFDSLRGQNGLVLLFFRSADW